MYVFDKPSEEFLTWTNETGCLIDKARKEGLKLAWDRLASQTPQCNFCEMGLSCAKCVMGPCRIIPGLDRDKGVCGADADLTVARNFGRFVAGGSAAHSDHGRDLVEVLHAIGTGHASAYQIRDEGKLRRLAEEFGLKADGDVKQVAKDVAERLGQDYSTFGPGLAFLGRLPKARRELWDKLSLTPRGIDR